MRINWHLVREFGDHDTIGRLIDGRWFWTWNLGSAIGPEKLLEMGAEDGENGGEVFDTYADLLRILDDVRPELARLVRATWE